MEFIRTVEKVKENKITIALPEDYQYQEVEVIVLPTVPCGKKRRKKSAFKSFTHISLDTRKYKFNRDELHER